MPEIGFRIKKVRELKGFKQEYMAEKLGISQQTYSKLENDKADIPYSRIEQLAEIFEMKPEELISFDSQYVFYNYGNPSQGIAYNHYNFPEKMQQLYEDKIKLYEEQVQLLKEKITYLEKK